MPKNRGVDETLLSVNAVYLFGRALSDIKLKYKDPSDKNRLMGRGQNNFLASQLRNVDAKLARIYSFAYEGSFYELARPTVFLVHGEGADPDAPLPKAEYERLARSPGRITRTGVARHFGAFSTDVKVWVYDKGDFSMRMDIETGTFDEILLEAELAAGDGATGGGFGRSSGGRSSGAMGRSSGGRSSGAMGRSSGWMPRRSNDQE